MAGARKLEKIAGVVEREQVRAGTASEHRATVLTTRSGERLILQRLGANPFADEATQLLAGRRIAVKGYRLGDIFRYLEAVDDDS